MTSWLCPLTDQPAVLVRVRAQPGARLTAVRGEHGDRLKIAVAAPPVDGKANEALCRFIAGTCGLPHHAVTLARGTTGRDKLFRLEGIDPQRVVNALTPS